MQFLRFIAVSVIAACAAGAVSADTVRVVEGSGARITAVYHFNGVEVAREYFDNGHFVKSEGVIPDGTVRQYAADSKTVIAEWQYEGGRKHGTVKKFYGNGAVRTVTPYREGRKDGINREYAGSGRILREESWRRGVLEGATRIYDSGGKLFAEIPYRNNAREGIAKVFYDNGSLGEETEYRADRPVRRTVFSPAGQTVLNKIY